MHPTLFVHIYYKTQLQSENYYIFSGFLMGVAHCNIGPQILDVTNNHIGPRECLLQAK